MDKKLLGNFIIAFPTAAYVTFNIVMNNYSGGFDWIKFIITMLIVMTSYAIGNRIKNKGEAE
ncbi:hypothetical protein [Winogradskyella sp. PG-2]|uniref:hypothetical protein n=1 Tax=Winogradskyella sp. PG-2 TaxID=754409 RepID=UPI000458640D|nr:hypothetical protein [Winogradskyella sp. PG-2]BAO74507.1 hypothetical protein WPG_0277 [Winogradskyella sp. PG-2]